MSEREAANLTEIAPNLMRKSWIAIGIGGAILAVLNLGLDLGTYPSAESAEKFLRRAVDGEWQAFLLDGTPHAPRDVGSIEAADCQKDAHIDSDSPLFACVYRFESASPPRDYIGVVGALYWRGEQLPTVDGYVVYAWATSDQREVLQARSISFPLATAP